MEEQIQQFYARFAPNYDLIFADFEQTVRRQGDALDRLIGVVALRPTRTVLDCSCGIGTQALGLAAHGYTVTATDLSPAAVERARREAAACGVTITLGVADFRRLEDEVEGQFDIVLSCDNSVAHLLTDDDLRLAANSMHSKVKPGGLLLLSIRDYDALLAERPRATPVQVYDGSDGEGQRAVFQIWEWAADGRAYTMHQFILNQEGDDWRTTHLTTQLRAIPRDDLAGILHGAGFIGSAWHMPKDSGYYQPIVTARSG